MGEIKLLDQHYYHEISSLSQFAFQYELNKEEYEKRLIELEQHTVWGMMMNDQLAAKLHLLSLGCYINGQKFKMGGIAGVATWPEYRRQGSVKELLHHALNHMKNNGQTISFLHPFSVPFYRKYGWELTFVNRDYVIPIKDLKRKWNSDGYVRRMDPDIPLLNSIYEKYANNYNGMLTRDEDWWRQQVIEDKSHIAIVYSNNDEAEGYMIYHVKEEIVTVEEMISNSLNGLKGLLQFISNHDSMAKQVKLTVPENDNLPLLIDEPRFEQKTKPYFMARIVDVEAFLNQYPFKQVDGEQNILLHITDSFLPENNGIYKLSRNKDDVRVTLLDDNHESESGIECSVQMLTSMLLGYKRPKEVHDLGLISGEKEQVELFESFIPNRQTYFPDFF